MSAARLKAQAAKQQQAIARAYFYELKGAMSDVQLHWPDDTTKREVDEFLTLVGQDRHPDDGCADLINLPQITNNMCEVLHHVQAGLQGVAEGKRNSRASQNAEQEDNLEQERNAGRTRVAAQRRNTDQVLRGWTTVVSSWIALRFAKLDARDYVRITLTMDAERRSFEDTLEKYWNLVAVPPGMDDDTALPPIPSPVNSVPSSPPPLSPSNSVQASSPLFSSPPTVMSENQIASTTPTRKDMHTTTGEGFRESFRIGLDEWNAAYLEEQKKGS